MSSMRSYIDSCITSGSYKGPASGIYGRIHGRISYFVDAKTRGALNPAQYNGIDRLVADRVNALCKTPSSVTEADTTIPTVATTVTTVTAKALYRPVEDEGKRDGYVVWAGNESFIAPWFTTFISEDSGDDSSLYMHPSQSVKFSKLSTDVSFNSKSSTVLGDQDRQISLSLSSVLKFSKQARTLTISTNNDTASFNSNGAGGDPIRVIKIDDLPSGDNWSIGKMLVLKDTLIFNIARFGSDQDKQHFEKPIHYTPTDEDAEAYNVDFDIYFVDLGGGTVDSLKSNGGSSQVKVNVIRGYTDFIIHQSKVFAIRSKSCSQVTFSGFRLSKKDGSRELIKTGKVSHSIDSYTFEVVELAVTSGIEQRVVGEVKPKAPESGGKFGITGSTIAYTGAKLAASDLCPYTFYVQLFYELVLQFPYSYDDHYDVSIFCETGMGKKLRKGSSTYSEEFYDAFIAGDIAEAYRNSTLVSSLLGIKLGGITKIAGHLYIEMPTTRSEDGKYSVVANNTIYELTEGAQPVFSPETSSWKRWRPMQVPDDYYPWNWWATCAYPMDIYVVWHMVSDALGTGSAKSSSIVGNLNLTLRKGYHDIVVDVNKRKENGEKLPSITLSIAHGDVGQGLTNDYIYSRDHARWMQSLDVGYGDFPFPYQKRYCFGGGNRGTTTWGVSGYDSCCETFLVTFAGENVPLNGQASSNTARPVLIIAGLGPYAEAWGAKGWGGQISPSPLVVEVYAYDTANGTQVDKFSKVNGDDYPKVYMQGTVKVMGIIGNYYTGYDLSDPIIELAHGMYPIPTNGYYISEDKDTIARRSYTFYDMRINPNNLRQIYYTLFTYQVESNMSKHGLVLVNNHYMETRAYEVKNDDGGDMTICAAKALAYWWSKTIPAKAGDPTPWLGPARIDMHVRTS